MTTEKEQILKNEENRFIPVSKWNDVHKYPTVKALRQIIFHKDKNGFEKVLRKVGGRLYICEKDFFAWLDSDCRLAV